MKKPTVALLIIATTQTYASTHSVDQITNLSHANSLNPYHNINAASPATFVHDKFGFSLSLGGSISGEIGSVDFVDEIDDLINELDRTDITFNEANNLISRFNDTLINAESNGYAKGTLNLLPPLSMYYNTDKYGTFTLTSSGQASGDLSILSNPLTYNPISAEIETGSAMYVKSLEHFQISLGHSIKALETKHGNVFFGSRLTGHAYGLSKQVITLESIDSNDSVEDIISDTYKDNKKTSYIPTLDIGAIWQAKYYSVGLNVANINSPRVNYGTLDTDCSSSSQASKESCFAAKSFANKINLKETFELTPQATGSIAVHNKFNTIGVEFSGQSKANAPLGDEYQWVTAAAYITPPSFWVPSARLTYAKNLAGSELSYAILGVSLFNVAEFELGASLDNASVNDTKIPRSAFAKLQFGIEF